MLLPRSVPLALARQDAKEQYLFLGSRLVFRNLMAESGGIPDEVFNIDARPPQDRGQIQAKGSSV
jgi:hypothetical protein